MNKDTILSLLEKHQSHFEDEMVFRDKTIDFVHKNNDFYLRSNQTGHLTGSACVLSPDQQSVLLIFHKKLNKWLQPGGHIETEDNGIAQTALREALEECGIEGLSLLSSNIFDIDIHEIPEKGNEPKHFHYDIRFAFVAQSKDFLLNPNEVKDIKWVDLADLRKDIGLEWSVGRMVEKSMPY